MCDGQHIVNCLLKLSVKDKVLDNMFRGNSVDIQRMDKKRKKLVDLDDNEAEDDICLFNS